MKSEIAWLLSATFAVLLTAATPTICLGDQKLDELLLAQSGYGNLDEVTKLVQQGANVNSTNEYGHTPLFRAAGDGHIKVVRFLIDKGANVNAKTKSGDSILTKASGNLASAEVTKLLLEAGATPDPAALAMASLLNQTDKVTLLLKAGIGPDVGLGQASLGGHVELVRLLLDKGAKINAVSDSGTTALHVAALQGGLPTVKLLVDRGADVNAVNKDGETPLHMAVSGDGNLEIIKLLVNSGAKINLADNQGITPIRFAGKFQRKEIYDWLLSKSGGSEPSPVLAKPRQPAAAAKPIAQLLADLESDKRDAQEAAAQALVLHGKDVVPEILKRIEGGAGIEKYYGVFAALGPNAEAALPLLKSQLSKKEHVFAAATTIETMQPGGLRRLDEATLQKAAEALYDGIVDPKADVMAGISANLLVTLGKPAVPTILRLLRHDEPGIRAGIARKVAAVRLPNEEIQHELSKMSRDDKSDAVRSEAAAALTQGSFTNDAKALLLGIVRSKPPAIGQGASAEKQREAYEWQMRTDRAARQLGQAYGADIVEDLVPLLSPVDRPERNAAILALQSAGAPAAPRLVELLDHDDSAIRVSASVALNRIGQPAVPALTNALQSEKEHIIEGATDALWWIGRGAKAAQPELLKLAGAGGRSDFVRLNAARAALKIDPASGQSDQVKSTIPALIRILDSGSFKHQGQAAEVLGGIGPAANNALPILRKRLELPAKEANTEGLVRDYVQRAAKKAISAIEARDNSRTRELRNVLMTAASGKRTTETAP